MVYVKLVLVAIMWGGTFIATQTASQVFGSFTGASFRYIIALLFMIPMMYHENSKAFQISKKQFKKLFILGFSGIFAYSFFFFNGLRLVKASHGSLIVALNPALVMLLSAVLGKEKISFLKVVGLISSILGVILVISHGNVFELFDMFSWGDAFMLGCPVSWAFYTYYAKDALGESTPLQASTWAILLGLSMILVFVPFEPFPSVIAPKVWGSLTYLGICGSVLGFVWYYEGVKKIGPVKTSVFNNLIPIFAMIISMVLLKETLQTYMIYGSILVIGGVLIINRF